MGGWIYKSGPQGESSGWKYKFGRVISIQVVCRACGISWGESVRADNQRAQGKRRRTQRNDQWGRRARGALRWSQDRVLRRMAGSAPSGCWGVTKVKTANDGWAGWAQGHWQHRQELLQWRSRAPSWREFGAKRIRAKRRNRNRCLEAAWRSVYNQGLTFF